MRRTITISVPDEMYEYIDAERGMGTVSEYFRSLVRRDQRRRQDPRSGSKLGVVMLARDTGKVAEIRRQLDKMRDILDGRAVHDNDD